MLTYLLFVSAVATVTGLALCRASAKHRTSEEDRLDHAENTAASELRSYHGGGWMARHREIADQERAAKEFEEFRLQNVLSLKSYDDIDRIYIESEGQE